MHDDDRGQALLMEVAEVDGPVRSVLRSEASTPGPRSLVELSGSSGSTYAFLITDYSDNVGVLGGRIGAKYPTFVRHNVSKAMRHWVTPSWFVTGSGGQVKAEAWEGEDAPRTIFNGFSGESFGAPEVWASGIHDEVFLNIADEGAGAVVVWTPQNGTQAFLHWPGDRTRAAMGFATDGRDMAWLYTENIEPGKTVCESPSVYMTAPYTVDPAALASSARRVGPSPNGGCAVRLAVGCGYIADSQVLPASAGTNGGLSLVAYRIADGKAFVLPSSPITGDYQFSVLGIGCELDGSNPEIFAVMSNIRAWNLVQTIVRVSVSDMTPMTFGE